MAKRKKELAERLNETAQTLTGLEQRLIVTNSPLEIARIKQQLARLSENTASLPLNERVSSDDTSEALAARSGEVEASLKSLQRRAAQKARALNVDLEKLEIQARRPIRKRRFGWRLALTSTLVTGLLVAGLAWGVLSLPQATVRTGYATNLLTIAAQDDEPEPTLLPPTATPRPTGPAQVTGSLNSSRLPTPVPPRPTITPRPTVPPSPTVAPLPTATAAPLPNAFNTLPLRYRATLREASFTVRAGPGYRYAVVGTLTASANRTYQVEGEAKGELVGSDDVWSYLPEYNGFVSRTALRVLV